MINVKGSLRLQENEIHLSEVTGTQKLYAAGGTISLSGGNLIFEDNLSFYNAGFGDVADINLATGKVLVTKEWVNAFISNDIPNTVATAINYTAVNNDFVLATAGYSGIAITLPTAATKNQRISIKKIDSGGGKVQVDPQPTETIDGSTPYIITGQYHIVTVVSDGTNWHIESRII